jgi:hypothetical protein
MSLLKLHKTAFKLLLIGVMLFTVRAEAENHYFQPDSYQYPQYSPWSSYCGPSTCANVLPSMNLAPSQVNPVYRNHPEVQKYWEVQREPQYLPNTPSLLPRYSTNNSPMANYEIYRNYKIQAYGPQYAPPELQTPTAYPISNSNGGAPLSNAELYKLGSPGYTPTYSTPSSYKPQYTPASHPQGGSTAPLSNLEIWKQSR